MIATTNAAPVTVPRTPAVVGRPLFDARPTIDVLERLGAELATLPTDAVVRELTNVLARLHTAHPEHADIALPIVRRMLGIAKALNKAKLEIAQAVRA